MKHLKQSWLIGGVVCVVWSGVAWSEPNVNVTPRVGSEVAIPTAVSLMLPQTTPSRRDIGDEHMRGRMTQEERRSLREDISGAGRHLYSPEKTVHVRVER